MKAFVPLPPGVASLVAKQQQSVLLETTRMDAENHCSYLFLDPIRTIEAHSLSEIEGCFALIQEATRAGLFVAGYLAYEAGFALQGLPQKVAVNDSPLLWFGVYPQPAVFDHLDGTFTGAAIAELPTEPIDHNGAFDAGSIRLRLSAAEHAARVDRVKENIAAGATYQINLTDQVDLASSASAATIYTTLVRQQPVAYAGFLHTETTQILSFSPELFFRVRDGRIVTRPMKGTWPRGLDASEDVLAAIELQNSEKNRSEHLMIVDLLRNDLGRICSTGSIRVDDLFSVERYPSLLQMTSTVSGTLIHDLSWLEIFRSLFPSGSITGAPKLSSMSIIHQLESSPRGVYTGAIGYIAPTGDACFNVAIRTLVHENGKLSMGVGGGIVADSIASEEYAECVLKTAFLRKQVPITLIETMRWDAGYTRLDMHLERLSLSCEYFGIPFSPVSIKAHLEEEAATFQPFTHHRVRLTLSQHGDIEITTTLLQPAMTTCRVRLSPTPTSSGDLYLRHKTTRRQLYEQEWTAAQLQGFDDLLYFNERGELTEGAISSVFLRLNGKLCTPPLRCGVLPGIFRRHLLETLPAAEETVLTLQNLLAAEEVFLCNSVRGLRRVTDLQTEPTPLEPLSHGPLNLVD